MFDKLPTGERQCRICFKIVSNYRNHYYIHNPGNFRCPICNRKFARRDQMKQHAKSVHADEYRVYQGITAGNMAPFGTIMLDGADTGSGTGTTF